MTPGTDAIPKWYPTPKFKDEPISIAASIANLGRRDIGISLILGCPIVMLSAVWLTIVITLAFGVAKWNEGRHFAKQAAKVPGQAPIRFAEPSTEVEVSEFYDQAWVRQLAAYTGSKPTRAR